MNEMKLFYDTDITFHNYVDAIRAHRKLSVINALRLKIVQEYYKYLKEDK